jgi:hypothetical protein
VAPEQVAEAEALLRSGSSLDAACAALEVSRKTLERAWVDKYQTTPARWLREQGLGQPPAGPSPLVFFRYPSWDVLARVAEEDGLEPNAWARRALDRAIARRR